MPLPVRNLLRGPALSLASQLIGLAQLAVLLLAFGATNATDGYFYVFNLGLLPVQILTVGVMYPLLLNNERISKRAAGRVRWATTVLAVVMVAIGAAIFTASGRLTDDLWLIFLLSAANAAVQSRVWFRAVLVEAEGDVRWISSVALPANVLATLVLLLPWGGSESAVIGMLAALAAGNLGLLVVMRQKKVGDKALNALQESASGRSGLWFFSKSAVGYGGLMVLQSLAVFLPPSALTLLSLAIKIVGSASATFVNAVMPALVHQSTESAQGGKRFLRIMAVVLASCGAVFVFLVGTFFPDYLVPAVILALWLVASASAAASQRMAFRFLRANASRMAMAAVIVVVVLATFSTNSPGFQLVTLLSAYAAVDACTGFLLLVALRDRLMAFVSGTTLLLVALIWGTSLI